MHNAESYPEETLEDASLATISCVQQNKYEENNFSKDHNQQATAK